MKRTVAFATALLFSSFPALAAEAQGGNDFSLLGVFVQMLGSLAVVIGVIALFYYLSSRWLKVGAAGTGERHIRLVETRHLAPKKSLILVEVGGEFLLLGSSGDGLNFIKQIDILEEIEVVDERDTRGNVISLFQGKLDVMLAKVPALKGARAANAGRQSDNS